MAKGMRLLVAVVLSCVLMSPLGIDTPAQAGLGAWFQTIWPKPAGPEDPHLYPEGSLLYDVWTCKGETDIGWVGVTNQFTDHDPYVVVVVRSEFPEHDELEMVLSVELQAPRHGMIVASDRVDLKREQDIAFFYHPEDLSRLGGWGEYRVVFLVDGIPREEINFTLEREEDLLKKKKAEEQRKQAEAALRAGGNAGGDLEAKALLGDPDSPGDEGKTSPAMKNGPQSAPQIEVHDPDDWYHTRYENDKGKIIMFPKKARRTWQENVNRDLRHRIQYYLFLD